MNIMEHLLLAVEFGFKCSEKGWNLDQTITEFIKTVNGKDEDLTNAT